MTSRLSVRRLEAAYAGTKVLADVSFDLQPGSGVAFLGVNGAGKTTLLRAISGLVRKGGDILLDGERIRGQAPDAIARLGVAHIPQDRGTFLNFSVEENLMVGGISRRDRVAVARDLAGVYRLFPVLAARRRQTAGSLSGGEQQMLAIGRGLMLRARLFLLDEPSLGLAPLALADLIERLAEVRAETGASLVIAEQNWRIASRLANEIHVLEGGRIAFSAPADDPRIADLLRQLHLGV